MTKGAEQSRPVAPGGRAIQKRWRSWTNRLWLLSIALGAMTVFSIVSVVHGKLQRPDGAVQAAILLFTTVLVTALAFGSARREAALASARADFIAGISHDLRMPLAQILLAGETLTMHQDLSATERHGLASSIVRESRRLTGLVENLLLFSRSGAVDLSQRSDPVDVDQLFSEVIDSVHLAAKDAGQMIATGASTQLVVSGDRLLLRQALVNLVDNSLKYGSPGQHVRLLAERVAQGQVHLGVEDEGPGIPGSERHRVFDAYERLNRDQSSERTGAGLGLAVVSDIARACGGRAFIAVARGRGTRAVIALSEASPAPGAH